MFRVVLVANSSCIRPDLTVKKNTLPQKSTLYPRKCELCGLTYKHKGSFYHHKKKCLEASSPENYPKPCLTCNEIFSSHKIYVPHKKYCKSKGKDNSKRKKRRTDNGEIDVIDCNATEATGNGTTEEADNSAEEVGVSLSHLNSEQSSIYERCETCCSKKRVTYYYYHRKHCLASNSSKNRPKYLTNHGTRDYKATERTGNGATEEIDNSAERMLDNLSYLNTEKPSVNPETYEMFRSLKKDRSNYPPQKCVASNSSEDYPKYLTNHGAIEVFEEQKEVSKKLKIVSDQCQNMYEECKKSKENSATMMALLKENCALYKSLASDINLILQMKIAKNNVQIISNSSG